MSNLAQLMKDWMDLECLRFQATWTQKDLDWCWEHADVDGYPRPGPKPTLDQAREYARRQLGWPDEWPAPESIHAL